MKKFLILFAVTVAAISWLMIIPIGVGQSYTRVETFKASTTDVVKTVDCQGTIEAAVKEQVTVGCQVKISKNYFNIGDNVKKGDKLFAIDKNFTLQVLANNGAASSSSSSSSSQITSDDASNALKQALSSGIIAQSTYNNLLGQINKSGSSSISVPSVSTATTANGTETDNAKVLDNVEASLCAPISGVITDIANGFTGITPAATSVATIVDMSSIQVKAQVNEEDIKNVKVGQQVHISGPGFNGTYSGVVKKVYPIAEDVTSLSGVSNMVNVIVSVDKPGANLLPGLTAVLKIKVSEQKGVVKLPYDSIKQDDNGTEYVYVFKNGCAVRKNIITGIEDDNGDEILEGVNRGEIIIKDPSDTITNGTNVRIK